MRIVDIRETAIPLKSSLANSSFDFSEMTTSVVAVITDVMREGAPITGFAFNSTGRYACGAQMRARFIPRILAADPASLLDAGGENFDPAKILAAMMQREKSGGHSERSIGIGTIEVAVWDAVAKIARKRCIACSPSATTAGRWRRRCSATSAAAGIGRDRASRTCRTRCAAISTPATPC
ncbi:MAG: D(-)-tartrate dehydratase [Alphaproteobacteria bacterium]|nr:D(-)-tartrate dehydratase [Alphaproteobacteria bacterium]